jgi:conjugal transfer pilus assembly protein TraB
MKDAMDRIADYYLRLADKIFPVLEIDAGRQVDIVVTQSASIEREMP